MSGEHERPRNEPSFSEEGIDSLDSDASVNQVDLDQLLNEIDQSMAGPSSSSTMHCGKGEDTASTFPPDDEPPLLIQPKQSALDFGAVEQDHDGERFAPLPDHTDDNLMGEEPMSRGVVMAGGAVVALSLLCGVVGLFVAFSASGKIEALQQSVDALQTRLATMQVSGDPRVGQLQAEQAGLTSRIDELAMTVDGLASAPARGGDSQLSEVRKRLDALERKASQPAKSTAATTTKTSTTSAATKPAASSGDWTVILVSFPTSAQAESEKTRIQKLGLRADVLKSTVDGKAWFRVRVPGYASQEAAKAAIPALQAKSGISGAWVAHR
jgi:cell division septation protein DedD